MRMNFPALLFWFVSAFRCLVEETSSQEVEAGRGVRLGIEGVEVEKEIGGLWWE